MQIYFNVVYFTNKMVCIQDFQWQITSVLTSGEDNFGLKYGMPRFSPLSIKIIARMTARTGIILLILLRSEALMCFPRIEAASIIGSVPRPNNAMNSVPDNTLSVATAPPIAT